MSVDADLDDEPEMLPEEIVHWQPNHRPLAQVNGAVAHGAEATGGQFMLGLAIGAMAVGAVAIGAMAIGALAIGRLSIRQARFERLEIGDLVVRRLRVLERR